MAGLNSENNYVSAGSFQALNIIPAIIAQSFSRTPPTRIGSYMTNADMPHGSMVVLPPCLLGLLRVAY